MPPVSSVGASAPGARNQELSEDDARKVAELARRDREVRQHEQAHIAAAGGYARGGPTYTYTRGPDGKQYATGGEVQIDTSAARTPEQTIVKARVIRRAALAPAEPSAQDRAVAAAAAKLETDARQQIAQRALQEQGYGKSGAREDKARDTPAALFEAVA
jgi:hypothetical protein